MEKSIAPSAVGMFQPSGPKPALSSLIETIWNSLPTFGSSKAIAAEPLATGQLPEGIRIVALEEYKEAAQCLAEAFADDDSARYFIDTPDRADWTPQEKWDLHVSILEYCTYAHCLKGLVTTTGPNYDCVALWMPPGENMDDIATLIRSGLWRLQYQLSAEGKKRFFSEFLPLLHDTKASVLGPRDDDSWYLVYIGTKPSGRKRGYAKRLIEYVTALADQQGQPCYLESSNPIEPSVYTRMGFQKRKTIHLQRAEKTIPLGIMVREPQAPTGAEGANVAMDAFKASKLNEDAKVVKSAADELAHAKMATSDNRV